MACMFLIHTGGKSEKSVLQQLDQVVKERFRYGEIKESRIDSLKQVVQQTEDPERLYKLYHNLFKEYRSYNMDSALYMAEQKAFLSQKLNKPELIFSSDVSLAQGLATVGMYKEALDILDRIDKRPLDDNQRSGYLHIYHSVYKLLADNSFTQTEKEYYTQLVLCYKDSLLQVNPPGTLGYYLIEKGIYTSRGDYDKAFAIMDHCYTEFGGNESYIGILAYELAELYEHTGQTEEEKKYLAISAVSDLQAGVKEYIALYKLAVLLYREGDIDRAYTYIKCSLEDATYSKARFRTLEMSEALPIITAAYEKKEEQEKAHLKTYLLRITLLLFILLVSLICIAVQLRRIWLAKRSIHTMYEELKKMNEELNGLNRQLAESNVVKEAYIGSVFTLCSQYIDKMEAYRIHINRRLRTGKVEEAVKITSSTSLVPDELKAFYATFDSIFLSLFPHFIEQLNQLLKEGEQIVPKKGDLLSPELRVFALVRLGISESSKIAGFLHYSLQTVYNYKLKVRNKSFLPKEEFNEALQQIGM